MVPLTAPWALLGGLAAAGALIAIYLYQRRYREREVSSLLLWAAIRSPASGGRTRERLRMPLTFWLELAALALLALAIAAPLLPSVSRSRPLVVVLDDSLSMQLSRERGRAAVQRELAGGGHSPIRVVLAGDSARMAGPAASDSGEALRQLAEWKCLAPAGDLDAAIALALRSGGRDALILVLTDHAPPTAIGRGRMKWLALGEPIANLAFVGAARSASEKDRATFEIANFANAPQSTELTVSAAGRVLSRARVELAAHARRRLDSDLPPNAGAVEAAISGGAPFDDRVTLLPERRPPVRTRLDLTNQTLRELVTKALEATERVRIVDAGAELAITDHGGATEPWWLELDAGKAASAFLGPFIVDRTHPLTDGVAFDGVIWGAGSPHSATASRPIVLAGDRPLITDEESESGGHVVRMSFDPASSNLQRSPAWPALLWNLAEWRSAAAPGFRYANVPLGGTAVAVAPPRAAALQASVRAPDGSTRDVAATNGTIVIAATQPGVWTLRANNETFRFSSNALLPEESDFAHATRGEFGGWTAEALETNGFVDAAWIALLVAIAILVAHQRATAEAVAS